MRLTLIQQEDCTTKGANTTKNRSRAQSWHGYANLIRNELTLGAKTSALAFSFVLFVPFVVKLLSRIRVK